MLYETSEHTALTNHPWSKDLALETAHEIYTFICEGQNENGLWAADPTEESEIPFKKGIYYGASGTLMALIKLSQQLKVNLAFEPSQLISLIHEKYLIAPDTGSVVPSLLLGESGILLLKQKLNPSVVTLGKLRSCIEANARNPVNELLWGSPGTMLAALEIGEIDLYLESANHLFEEWIQVSENQWAWTQDLYGKKRQFAGAGHGFFGNVQSLLKGSQYLKTNQREKLLERTALTAIVSSRREGGKANWNPYLDTPAKTSLVQWCHGAPGAIISLSLFPKDYSAELEKLMLEAGELIWQAGPIDQPAALCHGTDGNGFALLKLLSVPKTNFGLIEPASLPLTQWLSGAIDIHFGQGMQG